MTTRYAVVDFRYSYNGTMWASSPTMHPKDATEIIHYSLKIRAVSIADRRSTEGDVVILSPASTSFDRFANFMERGRVFKDIVNALK